MRLLLIIALIISTPALFAQQLIFGKVVNSHTGNPIAFAKVTYDQNTGVLANIKGEFEIILPPGVQRLQISYPAYIPRTISIKTRDFIQIELSPLSLTQHQNQKELHEALGRDLIKRALQNKPDNDPRQALETFQYKSYNKLIVDKQRNLKGEITGKDPKRDADKKILPRSFLTEKVSTHLFKSPDFSNEIVEGFVTAGFNEPTYQVLKLDLEPQSIYGNLYPILETTYAGPLGSSAFKNYTFTLLDTTVSENRPVYRILFKPKRPRVVASLAGILHLDTLSLAVQKAFLQSSGDIELEVEHSYLYQQNEKVYFPIRQQLILRPGKGGQDIALLDPLFTVGTIQRDRSIINRIFAFGEIEEDLSIISTTTHYEIELNEPVEIYSTLSSIMVSDDAHEKTVNFWASQRQQAFTMEDELTAFPVIRAVHNENILRFTEIREAVEDGFFPWGVWDIDLGRFINYNIYEGLRLGVGGMTNEKFSERFRVNSFVGYGFRDRAFKYEIGGGVLLNQRTGTWWNLNYQKEIQEIAAFDYIRGLQDFSILLPRIANIDYHYTQRKLHTSLEHRFTSRLESELMLSRTSVSQIHEYAYFHKGETYRDYTVTEATAGFLWRPFSNFLSTPEDHINFSTGFPQITGQITQAFTGFLGGNFSYTKLGLKAEHEISRLDRSITTLVIEGNYGFGDLPLTHAFHADPNNPNRDNLLGRFSIAGRNSFETMFFNEFFSDRQASLRLRHQLRPFRITTSIRPELVFISGHAIGSFRNQDTHRNIEFNTLRHGYHEAGLELNQIFLGFGLSAAYRYGAYHLPNLEDNIAVKFTFQLQI